MKSYFEYPFNEKLKRKFKKYYNNLSLDQHGNKQELKTDLKLKRINKLIKFKRRDIVLDFGCSRGYLLKKIANKIKRGVGVDTSSRVIALTKRENYYENLKFLHYNSSSLKTYGENEFDKVLMIDVLEHVFNPDDEIDRAKKALRKNAILIIEVPFTGFLSELMFGRYHQGHLRYYDPNYLEEYLRDKKFTVKKIKTYNSVPFSDFLLKFNHFWEVINFLVNLIPSRFYPYFGEIIIVAEKEK